MVFCYVQNINFFCRVTGDFFFQNSTLGYMTKTLNQIIFFFLHQIQNIFFSNIGNENIFFRKKNMDNMKQPTAILVLQYWYTILVNLGPSNSDGSNTMDGSNLFESPANFPYIFKLKKIFRSNTNTSNSRT